MTMAAGRKKTAPKRGATNARRGRTPSKSAPPKAKTASPALRKTPTRTVAQKGARGGTQTKRAPANRSVAQIDAVLAAQFAAMAREFGQIRELLTELHDLRMLVEALTGMVEGLVANHRTSDGDRAPEATTAEAHRASAQDADAPNTAGDQRVPETAEPTLPAL
jgi:hypothetical protein